MRTALTILGLLAAGAANVAAHMQLNSPPPFRAANNPHTLGTPDDELLFPYNCCGKKTPMPCRGYLNLLGTPEGASVATWKAGSEQTWSLSGPAPLGGNHYGGSCQIGFSTDQGKTFHATVSYEGNCPHRHGGEDPSGQEYPFTVPSDLPNEDVIFAWTWVNREQEFFMNCAVVTIDGGLGIADNGSAAASTSALAAPSATAATLQSSPLSYVDDTEPAGPSTSPVVNEADNDSTSTSSAAPITSSVPNGCRCKSRSRKPNPECRSWCRSQSKSHKSEARFAPLLDVSMMHKRAPGSYSQRIVQRASIMPFSARPEMLFANVDNGCTTPKTDFELKYPSPGPDVVEGDGEYPLELPSGTC